MQSELTNPAERVVAARRWVTMQRVMRFIYQPQLVTTHNTIQHTKHNHTTQNTTLILNVHISAATTHNTTQHKKQNTTLMLNVHISAATGHNTTHKTQH